MNNTHATPPIYMYIVFFKSFPKVKRETYIKPIKDLCPLTTSMNRSSGTMTQKACCKHVIVHLGTVGKVRLKHLSYVTQKIMVETESTLRINTSLGG